MNENQVFVVIVAILFILGVVGLVSGQITIGVHLIQIVRDWL